MWILIWSNIAFIDHLSICYNHIIMSYGHTRAQRLKIMSILRCCSGRWTVWTHLVFQPLEFLPKIPPSQPSRKKWGGGITKLEMTNVFNVCNRNLVGCQLSTSRVRLENWNSWEAGHRVTVAIHITCFQLNPHFSTSYSLKYAV